MQTFTEPSWTLKRHLPQPAHVPTLSVWLEPFLLSTLLRALSSCTDETWTREQLRVPASLTATTAFRELDCRRTLTVETSGREPLGLAYFTPHSSALLEMVGLLPVTLDMLHFLCITHLPMDSWVGSALGCCELRRWVWVWASSHDPDSKSSGYVPSTGLLSKFKLYFSS